MSSFSRSVPCGSYQSLRTPPTDPEGHHQNSTTSYNQRGEDHLGVFGSIARYPQYHEDFGNCQTSHPESRPRSMVPCVGARVSTNPLLEFNSSPTHRIGMSSSPYTLGIICPNLSVSRPRSALVSLEEGPDPWGRYEPPATSFSNARDIFDDDIMRDTSTTGEFPAFGCSSNSHLDFDDPGFMADNRRTRSSSPAQHSSRAPSPQHVFNHDEPAWFDRGQSHACLPATSLDTLHTDLQPFGEGQTSDLLPAASEMQGERSVSRIREQNDEVNAIRKVGSCVRCQVFHEECDHEEECVSCYRARHNGTIHKMPCLRARMADTRLFRLESINFPNGEIPKLVKAWASKPNLTIVLTHPGYMEPFGGPQARPWLAVVCREFVPKKAPQQISLSKSWISRGKKIDYLLPAYAIPHAKLKETAEKLDQFLERYREQLANELIQSQGDALVSSTLAEAIRHSKGCKMLKGALDIALVSRLISKSFNLTDPETFGLSPVRDTDSPYHGRIPIPPFLDAQLDDLGMRKMQKLQKKTLGELKSSIVGSDKRREWLKIFLTTFVLLFNLEFGYQSQLNQMKRYGTHQRISVMDKWIQSAEIFKTYFHERCCGTIPFYKVWTQEAQMAGGIDSETMEYLTNIREMLFSREEELRNRARGPPEQPLVWVAGLFLPPTDL